MLCSGDCSGQQAAPGLPTNTAQVSGRQLLRRRTRRAADVSRATNRRNAPTGCPTGRLRSVRLRRTRTGAPRRRTFICRVRRLEYGIDARSHTQRARASRLDISATLAVPRPRTTVLLDQSLHVRMVLLLEVPGVDRDDGDKRQRNVERDLAPEVGRAGRVRLAGAARRDERRSVVFGACVSVSAGTQTSQQAARPSPAVRNGE